MAARDAISPDATSMTHNNVQSQKTVLVIGSSESPVTDAVSSVLSSWKLEFARDNEDALSQVEKSPFDLVIADQVTSGREDVELLQKVRQVRPHIRVIIVAEKRIPADVIAAIRAGVFSYLSKPFTRRFLSRRCNWPRRLAPGRTRLKCSPERMHGYVFPRGAMCQRPIGCTCSCANFLICPKMTGKRLRRHAGKCC